MLGISLDNPVVPTPVAPTPVAPTDDQDCVDTTDGTPDDQGMTDYDTLPPGMGLTDLKEKKVKKCKTTKDQTSDDTTSAEYNPFADVIPIEPTPVASTPAHPMLGISLDNPVEPTPVAPTPVAPTDDQDCVDTTDGTSDDQGMTDYDTLPPGMGLTDLKEKKVKKCKTTKNQTSDDTTSAEYNPFADVIPTEPTPVEPTPVAPTPVA